jgi:site-specific recombinase XerD
LLSEASFCAIIPVDMTDQLEDSAVQPLSEPVALVRLFPPSALDTLGPAARFAWEEFFLGRCRNRHTRTAYARAVRQFLAWTEKKGTPVERITPGMVGQYLDQLSVSPPSKKLVLAALRGFFDALVLRHVLILNPAACVRAERYEVIEGRTPEITADQARTLLASIETSNRIGLRDKLIIATLIYTAARAGAVSKLKRKDLKHDGSQFILCFGEKGGKLREIPVRHDLEILLLEWLNVCPEISLPDAPLFQTAEGRTGIFTGLAMSGTDIWRMVKKRLLLAGLPAHLSPHSFRVATITDLLNQGVPLGDCQYLAGHSDPRTTRLYDRRPKKVTRSLVERISI